MGEGGPEVWFFGSKLPAGVSKKGEDRWKQGPYANPAPPVAFGLRWLVEQDTFAPLPVTGSQLREQLAKLAKDAAGEPLPLDAQSLVVSPVLRPKATSEAWLVMAGKSQGPQPGQWVFFTARLSPAGLGQVQQLPFWVLLEEGREEPALEEDKGLLHLPSSAVLDALKGLSLAPDGTLGLYVNYRAPEDASERVWLEFVKVVVPQGQGVKILDGHEFFFRAALKQLSGGDFHKVLLFSSLLKGLSRWGEAVFAANCYDESKRFWRCAVAAQLPSGREEGK
jgi:hypothetical protein